MELFFNSYLLLINIAAFVVAIIDKRAAIHHKRRVSEKKLFKLAFAGGSVGLYVAMLCFRHKTKHWYFMVGVPMIILLQMIFFRYVAIWINS